MVVLGVDPGSRVCGYGVVEVVGPARFRYIECGVLTASERLPPEERLGEIARSLTEVVAELAPAVVAVEDVFTRKNHRSALALAQARGVVIGVAGVAGISVASYTAPTIKKSVTGHGRATKERVARMVQALVGLKSLPRIDATDALAVAITHGLQVKL